MTPSAPAARIDSIADLRYITAGESHGPALTAVVQGLPSGLSLDPAHVDAQLARRQAGYGRSPRQKLETDTATVTAGVRHGRTMGGPVVLTVTNRDHANWSAAMSVWPTDEQQGNWRDRKVALPRPGHADLGGMARGAFDELRPVLERSSARETAARVAAASLAQQLLARLGIEVRAHVRSIGAAASDAPVPARDDAGWASLDESQVRCLDEGAGTAMLAEVDAARADRDTLGGVVEVVAYGCPPGLGGYVTSAERLDGRLAGAVMSVQAMKGVEFGAGFDLATRRGSAAHDEMFPVGTERGASGDGDAATADGHSGSDSVAASAGEGMGVTRHSNHAGGIEGGMANGAPIVLRVAMKPLPTLMRPLASVDLATGEPQAAHAERSDTCAVPAAAIVLECAVAFELARVVREQFGSQAMVDVEAGWAHWCERVRHAWRPVDLATTAERGAAPA